MAVNKDGVYIAEDKDFQLINTYWVYKGEFLEVDITDFVNSKKLTSIRYMFSGSSKYGATAVKRVVLGENSVTNMLSMFNNSKTTSLDLSSFDTSSVTNMSDMFYGSKATSLDLSSFDTSRVTNMSGMFSYSQATSLDLSSFDTSSVTNMSDMFWDSQATTGYARNQADADKFNSSSGKPAGLVFVAKFNKDRVYIAEDKDFQSINGYWIYKGVPLEVDITDFVNNKKLTSIRYMFSGTSKYKSTAVKRVVLGKNSVTNMSYMFQSSQATSLDLSSFDTSSVTNMTYMFYGSQATSLDLSSFDTSSVTNMASMFGYSEATSLDLSSFDTSSVTNMSDMFWDSQATTGYARNQADADKFNSSSGKPEGLVFVAKFKSSFGTLNNHKIKSILHKDSNGIIKQVKTLKFKDNLGNITKLK